MTVPASPLPDQPVSARPIVDRLARHWRLGLLAAIASILAWLVPATFGTALTFAGASLIATLPVILLAVLATAWIEASGASGIVNRIFAGRTHRTIVVASFAGALTPICGIGVLPLIAGLLRMGVPLAPIMAFWLASPVTDPAMLAITAGTLGVDFAIGKTVIAFLIGLGGGFATLAMTGAGRLSNPFRLAPAATECCGNELPFRWNAFATQERSAIFRRSARETAKLILFWLAVAFVAEGFLRQWMPAEWVASVAGAGNDFAIPLAVLVGTPIYLDGYAALPLVRGLIDLGMIPGAAMALLVAGGITSLYASIAVYALVRRGVFLWYLALAIIGALAGGYLYQGYVALAAA